VCQSYREIITGDLKTEKRKFVDGFHNLIGDLSQKGWIITMNLTKKYSNVITHEDVTPELIEGTKKQSPYRK